MYKLAIGIAFGVLLFCNTAMAQCSSYPYTLTNGTTANATQVMANFNCAALTSGSTLTASTLSGATLTGTTTLPGSSEFTSGGHLLINTTADYAFLSAWGNGGGSIAYLRSASTADTFLQFIETGSGSATMAYFQVYGAGVGSIVSNNYGTTYNTTSDERLKNWQIPQKNYEQAIRSMWIGDFIWKRGGEASFGVRAQQAYSLFPAAIHKPANDGELWQADYGRLAPLALWGVKNLYSRMDVQKRVASRTSDEIRELHAEFMVLKAASDDRVLQARELKAANDNQALEIGRLEAQVAGLERKIRIRTAQR